MTKNKPFKRFVRDVVGGAIVEITLKSINPEHKPTTMDLVGYVRNIKLPKDGQRDRRLPLQASFSLGTSLYDFNTLLKSLRVGEGAPRNIECILRSCSKSDEQYENVLRGIKSLPVYLDHVVCISQGEFIPTGNPAEGYFVESYRVLDRRIPKFKGMQEKSKQDLGTVERNKEPAKEGTS